jgi:hypothetical protein
VRLQLRPDWALVGEIAPEIPSIAISGIAREIAREITEIAREIAEIAREIQ